MLIGSLIRCFNFNGHLQGALGIGNMRQSYLWQSIDVLEFDEYVNFLTCSDLQVEYASEENASMVYTALSVDKEVSHDCRHRPNSLNDCVCAFS